MKKHITYLNELHACGEAIEWVESFPTLQKGWDKCERGDWMLWLLGKQSGKSGSQSRKKLVLTACKCARLALKYVPKNEKRPLKAIQTAEKWGGGDSSISLADVKNAYAAAYAAYAAYAASATADAAYAAYAAAASADAVSVAASATASAYAAAASASADAVSVAASATASAAIINKVLKQCADIVREDYPKIRIK